MANGTTFEKTIVFPLQGLKEKKAKKISDILSETVTIHEGGEPGLDDAVSSVKLFTS